MPGMIVDRKVGKLVKKGREGSERGNDQEACFRESDSVYKSEKERGDENNVSVDPRGRKHQMKRNVV